MLKRFEIPLYAWEVFFCNTKSETTAFLVSHGDMETTIANDRGISVRVTDSGGEGWRIMAVFEENIAVIAHEAVHTAWGMLNRAGIPVTFANDESLAYLTGWLVREFIRFTHGGETDEA
jgi:hypothetical protein